MHGDQAGDRCVHDAFRHFVAVLVQDRVVGHQVADVANEQQGATVQGQGGAVGLGVFAVRVHGAGEGAAALVDGLGQVTFHQAQPVAVDNGLVVGINGGDGVFAVHDGGQRRFHQHVFDAGSIGLADVAGRIDLDFEVQAVVLKQDGSRRRSVALEGDKLGGVFQAGGAAVFQANAQLAVLDGVAGGVNVGTIGQRCCLIKEGAGEGDNLVATDFVVTRALGGAAFFRDRVGTVQCIVQRAPACVGSVQGETGVHHRHNQLRAGHGGDFLVNVLGGGLEVSGFGQQVADLLQEGFVFGSIVGLTGACLVPCIDLRLEVVALGQQCLVLGSQVLDQRFDTGPEGVGLDTGTGNGTLVDKVVENLGYLQTANLDAICHVTPSLC